MKVSRQPCPQLLCPLKYDGHKPLGLPALVLDSPGPHKLGKQSLCIATLPLVCCLPAVGPVSSRWAPNLPDTWTTSPCHAELQAS